MGQREIPNVTYAVNIWDGGTIPNGTEGLYPM